LVSLSAGDHPLQSLKTSNPIASGPKDSIVLEEEEEEEDPQGKTDNMPGNSAKPTLNVISTDRHPIPGEAPNESIHSDRSDPASDEDDVVLPGQQEMKASPARPPGTNANDSSSDTPLPSPTIPNWDQELNAEEIARRFGIELGSSSADDYQDGVDPFELQDALRLAETVT
jgi:hypothetical protein